MSRVQQNFGHLIKQELVSRFESVVKNELDSFANDKSQINEALSKLQEELRCVREEVKALRKDMQSNLKIVADSFVAEKKKLQDEFEEQRRYLRICTDLVNKQLKFMNESISQFVSTQTLDEALESVKVWLLHAEFKIHESKKDLQVELHDTKTKLEHSFKSEVDSCLEKVQFLTKSMDSYSTRVNDFITSNEGFSKEILIYKKTLFIMEKHIEDLYTQISRLKR